MEEFAEVDFQVEVEDIYKVNLGTPGGSQNKYYKMGQVDPLGKSKLQPGRIYDVTDRENPKEYESVTAVLLYYTPVRKYMKQVDGKWKAICESGDGIAPMSKIAEPFCARLDKASLAGALATYKFDKARIQDVSGGLLDDKGRGCACAYQSPTLRRYPVCPMAMKDERGPGPCKESHLFYMYDLDHETQFRLTLTAGSLQRSKDYVAPFWTFRDFVAKQKQPASYFFAVVLKAVKGPAQFFVMDFAHPTELTVEQKKRFHQMAGEIKDRHLQNMLRVPQVQAPATDGMGPRLGDFDTDSP